jgi:glycosyltransferase involved in cell wall biosynthesis
LPHYVLDARTATPHYPGIGRYVSSLARAMIPQLAPGERLTIFHHPQHPLRVPDSPAVQLRAETATPFDLSQQWAIPRALRGVHADLYHSPYYLMPYRPRVRTVLTVYDVIPLRHPEHSTARARLLFRLTTQLALRAASRVIAISAAAALDFSADFGIAPERITAIPLAADPAFRPQSAEVIADVRARYGLPDRFILYLGSNKPHKNLVRLVQAWQTAGCKLQVEGCTLVVAGAWNPRYPEARILAESGESDTRSNLQSSIFNLQSILWLGPIPDADLPALYAAADAFVFPSLFEGFGLPVLEAMACGTPVICSNVSSLPEIAGDAALLFDPADVSAIADALIRSVSDAGLSAELAQRGLARVAAFTWERTAAETLAIYRQVAA